MRMQKVVAVGCKPCLLLRWSRPGAFHLLQNQTPLPGSFPCPRFCSPLGAEEVGRVRTAAQESR